MSKDLTEIDGVGDAIAEQLREAGFDTAADVQGATVDGRADHRIVMALSVAALAAEGTTTVRGAEHVDVSFPGFFDAMADLGMDMERDDARGR